MILHTMIKHMVNIHLLPPSRQMYRVHGKRMINMNEGFVKMLDVYVYNMYTHAVFLND